MKKKRLGKTNLEVSRIIYGGIVSMDDGQERSDEYVSWAIGQGINYFDIAPSYGDAQEKLGNSLIPFRKKIYLACKTGMRDAEGAKRELDQSLSMLHTDHFEVYQMHALTTIEEVERAFQKDGVFSVMSKAKEEGVLTNLGITCHSEEAALRALELYDFDTVLFPTNWALHMEKGFGSSLFDKIKREDIGFLGMKSMIHRAWLNEEEKTASRFPKSWCKPITDNSPLTIAAMRYALCQIGADVLVTPGNIESLTFALEHLDEILKPINEADCHLLAEELSVVKAHPFF